MTFDLPQPEPPGWGVDLQQGLEWEGQAMLAVVHDSQFTLDEKQTICDGIMERIERYLAQGHMPKSMKKALYDLADQQGEWT